MFVPSAQKNLLVFFEPNREEFHYNLNELNNCLKRHDFSTIIKNKDLFWLACCKAFYPHQNIQDKQLFYLTQISPHELHLDSNLATLSNIQSFIENLRELFIANYEKESDFKIEFLVSNIFINFKDKKGLGLNFDLFSSLIAPSLADLAHSLGAIYSKDPESDMIFNIQWKPNVKVSYPIEPISFFPRENLRQDFYDLFKRQKCCDFTLTSGDCQSIQVHSALLFLYGGEMVNKLLENPLLESHEKRISFKKFTFCTVQAFAEFTYLGPCDFMEWAYRHKIDYTELLEFASVYQIPALIDCSTNLISTVATPLDSKNITLLAKLYNNEHLKKLAAHLAKTINAGDDLQARV